MDNSKINQEITSAFGLDIPPIAMALVNDQPQGVEVFEGDVPSFCTFWRMAEKKAFYAPAQKHFNCPIGAMVLGFDMPEEVQEQLGGMVKKMCECSYLSEDEPANIPTIKEKHTGAVYGPLNDFPVDPQLILMWLKPSQAMIFNEALGCCKWSDNMGSMALGRPACAVIPTALNDSPFGMSLGCTGMRTFTEISDEHILATLNCKEIDTFLTSLQTTVSANKGMKEFYLEHKKNITG
tara:strand:+ start:265 stop:975 length:711 start_codon:yes stop_codon:yes gene_type:complete